MCALISRWVGLVILELPLEPADESGQMFLPESASCEMTHSWKTSINTSMFTTCLLQPHAFLLIFSIIRSKVCSRLTTYSCTGSQSQYLTSSQFRLFSCSECVQGSWRQLSHECMIHEYSEAVRKWNQKL